MEFTELSVDLPKRMELKNAVEEILKNAEKEMSVKEIEENIIKKFNLSEEQINFLHSDGISRKLDYDLRWVRTILKKEGIITNVDRGVWIYLNNIQH